MPPPEEAPSGASPSTFVVPSVCTDRTVVNGRDRERGSQIRAVDAIEANRDVLAGNRNDRVAGSARSTRVVVDEELASDGAKAATFAIASSNEKRTVVPAGSVGVAEPAVTVRTISAPRTQDGW